MKENRALDLFCGAGGLSIGAEMSGHVKVVVAINHWTQAIETHATNLPGIHHVCASASAVDPRSFLNMGINWLIASPECTNHCNAKGGKPYDEQSRASAWEVIRYADILRPEWIVVENVHEFQKWGMLDKNNMRIKQKEGEIFFAWLQSIRSMGYKVEFGELTASNYGAATTRTRLFIIATRTRRKIRWPEPTVTQANWKPASEIIDWSLDCPSIFDRKKPLVESTMRRIRIGIERFWGEPFITILKGASTVRGIDKPIPTVTTQPHLYLAKPFLVKLYGTGTVKSTTIPLDTITAGGNKFGLVKPFIVKYHGGGKERAHGIHEPLRTIDTSNRFGLVQPFFIKYYGRGGETPADQPLHTITTKERFALVNPALIDKEGLYMLDIGLRMLQPNELKAATGFPDDYVITGTKGDQVKQIGNAVCPDVMRAIVEANAR